MAKKVKSTTSNDKSDSKSVNKKTWEISKQHKIVLGCLLVLFSIALLVAFVSFFIYGHIDQSAVQELSDRKEIVQNWLGKFGAYLADLIIYRGFGIASFLFVRLFFLTGMYLLLDLSIKKLKGVWFWDLFVIIIISILFGFFCNFRSRIRRNYWL